MSHPRARDALALLVTLVLLTACGGDPSPAGDGPPPLTDQHTDSTEPETGTGPGADTEADREDAVGQDADAADTLIVVSEFAYELPAGVPAGSEVTVTNEDQVGHTVTSDDGLFDVTVAPGSTVTFTAPEEPGEYAFHCAPHPHMTATLVVE